MRIGVLGGTFDPIHNAHLAAAEEALFQCELDTVLFVPNARPPHKVEVEISPADDRYRMVELAIDGNGSFSISDIEIRRAGLSYTIDTLRGLHETYGAGTETFLIVGADELLEIDTWKEPQRVLAESWLVAAPRPGYHLEELKTALPEKTVTGEASLDRVLELDMPELGISATDIRERAASGRPFRYLVPDPVWAYITEKRLYG